jgi:Na+/H+-dicarboxylate symporter
MECVTENVGVDEEVSSFVLPLGATVNMDGTSLSGSSSHFIAQAMLPTFRLKYAIDDRGHGDLSFYRFCGSS